MNDYRRSGAHPHLGRWVVSFVTMTALLPACGKQQPDVAATPMPRDTIVVVDTVTIETATSPDAELRRQVARLSLELLEREAQLEALRHQRDVAVQEMVRTMTKLQIVASRAEAASALAEAKVAVAALEEPPSDTTSAVDQAQRLLDMSSAEFDRENFGGSLYLATQAKALAQTGGDSRRERVPQSLGADERAFALPLPLETITRSNVRSGPGLEFAVLLTLDGGIPLMGHSHTAEWIRITLPDRREGWIFHTLVRTRRSEGVSR